MSEYEQLRKYKQMQEQIAEQKEEKDSASSYASSYAPSSNTWRDEFQRKEEEMKKKTISDAFMKMQPGDVVQFSGFEYYSTGDGRLVPAGIKEKTAQEKEKDIIDWQTGYDKGFDDGDKKGYERAMKELSENKHAQQEKETTSTAEKEV